MKVWITKYALSKGIKETEVKQSNSFPEIVHGKDLYDSYHGEGKEWHRTKESALARAEEMRKKKIDSLRKQIEKLEKLRFEQEGL